MSKIYVLIGHNEYESSTVLAVYKSKESADQQMKACYDHKNSMPPHPLIDRSLPSPECFDTPEWRKHAKLESTWRKKLPFVVDYDSYYVNEYEVRP